MAPRPRGEGSRFSEILRAPLDSIKSLTEDTKGLAIAMAVVMGGALAPEAMKAAPVSKREEGKAKGVAATEIASTWVKDIPLVMQASGSEQVRPSLEDLRINPTFFIKKESGEIELNPWSIVAPLQIEGGVKRKQHNVAEIGVPYRYARFFHEDPNAKQPLREEDKEKIIDFLEQQLKAKLADDMYALDMSKNVYRYAHQMEHMSPSKRNQNVKVLSLEGTGFASPEGDEGKGSGTLVTGAIDPENIALARIRGKHAVGSSKKALDRLDIDTRSAYVKPIKAEELQFSSSDVRSLVNLSKGFPGADKREKIFNMIRAFNNGEISSEVVEKELYHRLGEKRVAKVKIEYEGDKKDIVLIPLPLLLLLLPKFPEIGKWIWDKFPKKPESPRAPGNIRDTKLPPLGSKEYEDMRERVLLDDFDLFFRHQRTEREGINYEDFLRQTRKELRGKSRDYKEIDEVELLLAEKILKAWEARDKRMNPRVSYQNDANQIREARMHAQVLVDLAMKQNEKPLQKITATLDEITRPYKHRRATRYARAMDQQIFETGKPSAE